MSKEETFESELTISTRGEYSGTVFYQDGKFSLANNILVMKMPELSKKQKQFIGSLINCLPYGGYNGYPTKNSLDKDKIKLPVKSGEINFEFMEDFITRLEADQIEKLETYLSVSGLKDYTLTIEEEQVLQDFEQDKINFDEFKICKLFKVKSYKKRFDANKVLISEIGRPYVVRTSLNNGVRGYINQDEQFLNEGNTISFGQDTATVFYQEKPYFTGDKIKILKSKDNRFRKLNALFFISTMTKSFSSFTWGGSSFSVKIIENQPVKIPTKNQQPDYEIMETFISAIQKLVIKDVVLYASRKSITTKNTVNKESYKN